MELTKESSNIEEMEKKVTEKRKRKSIMSGLLQSVKYVSILAILIVIALGAGFGVCALVTGNAFTLFEKNLEQPVMLLGAIAAMLVIKKEDGERFAKARKLTVPFIIGLMIMGFAYINAYTYFLLCLEPTEVHFNLSRQLAAMFIAPICEEFISRVMLTACIRKNGSKISIIALIITAFAFTMMHTPSGMLGFTRFMLFGLFVGYIYQRTGSYKACVLFHFASNAGATCIYLFANHFGFAAKVALVASFTVLFILGVILVVKELKKIR
jgi:membrane protease YdiL (CAAX protease family)